jgi:hypothetical protein
MLAAVSCSAPSSTSRIVIDPENPNLFRDTPKKDPFSDGRIESQRANRILRTELTRPGATKMHRDTGHQPNVFLKDRRQDRAGPVLCC